MGHRMFQLGLDSSSTAGTSAQGLAPLPPGNFVSSVNPTHELWRLSNTRKQTKVTYNHGIIPGTDSLWQSQVIRDNQVCPPPGCCRTMSGKPLPPV
jgi:hypothetical protein